MLNKFPQTLHNVISTRIRDYNKHSVFNAHACWKVINNSKMTMISHCQIILRKWSSMMDASNRGLYFAMFRQVTKSVPKIVCSHAKYYFPTLFPEDWRRSVFSQFDSTRIQWRSTIAYFWLLWLLMRECLRSNSMVCVPIRIGHALELRHKPCHSVRRHMPRNGTYIGWDDDNLLFRPGPYCLVIHLV